MKVPLTGRKNSLWTILLLFLFLTACTSQSEDTTSAAQKSSLGQVQSLNTDSESLTYNLFDETEKIGLVKKETVKSTQEFLLMFKEDVLQDRVEWIVGEFPGTVVQKHTFYLAMGEHYIYHLRVPEGETVKQWIGFYKDQPETKNAQPYYQGEAIQLSAG